MTDTELHILVLEHIFKLQRSTKVCGPSDYFIEGTRVERWMDDENRDRYVRVTTPDGDAKSYSKPAYFPLYPEDTNAAVRVAERVGLLQVLCLHQTYSKMWQLGIYVENRKGQSVFIPSMEDESLSRLLCMGSLRHVGCPEVPE